MRLGTRFFEAEYCVEQRETPCPARENPQHRSASPEPPSNPSKSLSANGSSGKGRAETLKWQAMTLLHASAPSHLLQKRRPPPLGSKILRLLLQKRLCPPFKGCFPLVSLQNRRPHPHRADSRISSTQPAFAEPVHASRLQSRSRPPLRNPTVPATRLPESPAQSAIRIPCRHSDRSMPSL